ncbi:competence protein CoiA [Streptococcus devriesei]|uniref:competence protein CoiA n=1 Tax=Streptococcus devriesei TaxID=231233 RepID=UPI0004048C18|nr:competence protein CoiA family protein [Streptococcus devriesei]
MLAAFDEEGKLVNLAEAVPRKQHFTCPACGEAVRLRHGSVMRPHFAHISLQNCRFYSENESAEHLGLKAELYKSFSAFSLVEVEKLLPELGQIADLMVNEKLALEVQCSRLSKERLHERTQAYLEHGCQVRWLLGEKLWLDRTLTSLQRDLLYFSANMGFHLWELDLDRRCLRLKYLIYEDWHGHVHYLVKECPFDDNLLTFLRLPFIKQKMASYYVKMDQQLLTYIQRQLAGRNPHWLKRQEAAYLKGTNLLSLDVAAFYPQVRPLESETGFCQITQDLSNFYTAFFQYYRSQENKSIQRLYPPAFYEK